MRKVLTSREDERSYEEVCQENAQLTDELVGFATTAVSVANALQRMQVLLAQMGAMDWMQHHLQVISALNDLEMTLAQQ